MSFENIRQTVLTTSEKEAEHIIKTAKKQAEQELQYQKNRAREESEHLYQIHARAIEEEYARRLIQHKGTLNKKILEERNAKLQEVFKRAKQAILSIPQEEYAHIMKRRIARISEESGHGMLRVHKEEVQLFQKLIDELNKEKGPEKGLAIDNQHFLDEKGGFIFIGPDFEVDQTVKNILTAIEHELLPVIAQELFAE